MRIVINNNYDGVTCKMSNSERCLTNYYNCTPKERIEMKVLLTQILEKL